MGSMSVLCNTYRSIAALGCNRHDPAHLLHNAHHPQPMPASQFIRYLDAVDGSRVRVKVVEADIEDAEAWDAEVQANWIAGSSRIDASWSWRKHYLRSALVEAAVARPLAYLQIQAATPAGEAFPMGQVILVDGFPYPGDQAKRCAFLWFLASAPSGAVKAAGIPVCRGLLPALVDVGIQFSYICGHQGRLCLHASPAGTPTQREQLAERYESAGLERHTKSWFIGRVRFNFGRISPERGRYFIADERIARELTVKLDPLR